MPGDFFERIDELADRVGDGNLEGKIEVDQIYAHYQHEGLDLRHPRGGEALYLQRPTLGDASQHMQKIADRTLQPEGPKGGMKDVVEDISRAVSVRAPVDFNNLRRSAHPTVTDNGAVVYDRPAEQRRLTEAELEALGDLRDGDRTRHSSRRRR